MLRLHSSSPYAVAAAFAAIAAATWLGAGRDGPLDRTPRGVAGAPTAAVAPTADSLSAYLEALEPFGFAGAALVSRGGEVLVADGYGVADRETGRPWTAETVSTVGSITKQFTAAGILLLEERGELSTDDSLPAFFEEVPEDKRSITLHHLLTHTSGLREVEEGDFDWLGREEIVRKALASEPGFPPGERFDYSNLGYSLLGAVIERVTGRGYEAWLREELLLPAGMRETGYVLPGFDPDRVAVGYDGERRFGTVLSRIEPERGPSWVLYANGGIHSTLSDMHRWARTLLEDRLLTADSRRRLIAAHVEGAGGHYGYGWSVDTTARGTPRIHHGGSNGIFYADFHLLPEEDVVLYVMTSDADLRASTVARQLDRLLFGGAVPRPPRVSAPAGPVEGAGEDLVGRYRAEGGGHLTVQESGGQLTIHVEGRELIGRVWTGDPGGSVSYEELDRRARSFVRALAAGDWEAVRTARGGDERERPYEDYWDGLVDRLGAFRSVEALGSVPGWFHEGSADVTWVRLRFERDSTIRRIHWEADGTVLGIGGQVYPAPLTLRCALESRDRCVGFHLSLSTDAPRLTFERGEDGRAAGLVLRTASGATLRAERVE